MTYDKNGAINKLLYTYRLQNLTVACSTSRTFSHENTEPGTMLISAYEADCCLQIVTYRTYWRLQHFENTQCVTGSMMYSYFHQISWQLKCIRDFWYCGLSMNCCENSAERS